MSKTPLLFLGGIGLVGYGVFHGHTIGKSCWLCPYRGMIFLGSSLALGVGLAIFDE